jgi:hypothetical protein
LALFFLVPVGLLMSFPEVSLIDQRYRIGIAHLTHWIVLGLARDLSHLELRRSPQPP